MITWFKNFFRNWVVAYYEIANWFYVLRIIRKHRQTADWTQYNLRADWIGRIYTVLNPQSPGDDGDNDEVLRLKYAERLKPISIYLDGLGLGQSVTLAYEKIQGSASYLFVYYPIFNVITTWRVILFIISVVIFFVSKLDTLIYEGLQKSIAYILHNFNLIF
jgi:hypothetical protein